jgi:hypothetical protein
VFTMDTALQHTCASFREQAARGAITAAECDLLIDGANTLAVNLETLIEEAQAGTAPSWREASHPPLPVMAASGTM